MKPPAEGSGPSRPVLRDVVAGTSVAAILIPQSMAYAELAGLPAHHGLYAAALPPVLAAFFASSRYLQTGPTALTSILILGALVPLAQTGTAAYVGLAALLALVVGVFRIATGLLRTGVVAYLMSQPVLLGFTAAAGLLIISSQLPGAVGVESPIEGAVGSLWWLLTHPGAWETASAMLALLTLGIVLGSRLVHPLVPGVLMATVAGLVFSVLTGYEGRRIGAVPEGFLPLTLDLPWRQLPRLFVPGLVIALVGFAEAASISRTFAARDREPWNPNKEFLSQGVANLVAGVTGGFAVGGSFSRSSLNRLSGARSRLSGAVAGGIVLIFLPFASLLAPLPVAVLSGIVIAAVLGLLRFRPLIRLWGMSRPQALVGWSTFLLTLVLAPNIEQAVLVGILLALGVHVWREMEAKVDHWEDGNTFHLEPHGVLWFGSAPQLEQVLMGHLANRDHEDIDTLVLHMGSLGRIDMNGAMVLEQIMEEAIEAGLDVRLAEVPYHAERILRSVVEWTPETVWRAPADEEAGAGPEEVEEEVEELGDVEEVEEGEDG